MSRSPDQRALRLLAAALLLPAPALSAQERLHEFSGSSSLDLFGQSVAVVPDLDGDGVDDILVGAPHADFGDNNTGSVFLYSGASGLEFDRVDGLARGEGLGRRVSRCGDVDGDGVEDFLACGERDPARNGPSGFVRVFSGADRSLLLEFTHDRDWSEFGWDADGAGDVNGDGVPDIIVGAPNDDWFGPGSGSAFVYSGADGSLLHTFRGVEPWAQCGFSVCGIGDLDGDGCSEFAVGSRLENARGTDSGAVRVYSGRTGQELWLKKGDKEDNLGYSLDGGGDLDGDGVDDWITGGMNDRNDNGAQKVGRVRVFTGATSTEIYDLETGDSADGFGAAVEILGDVNGDGFADFLVGSPFAGIIGQTALAAGRAEVFSGVSGRRLYQVDGVETSDNLGTSVAGGGDLDGDGFADWVVGVPGDNPIGSVAVYRSDTLPRLSVQNLAAGGVATWATQGGTPGAVVSFTYSLQGWGAASAFNLEFDILDPQSLGSATADGSGNASLSLSVPTGAGGTPVWFQAWESSLVGPPRVTNGLAAVVQ